MKNITKEQLMPGLIKIAKKRLVMSLLSKEIKDTKKNT